MPEYEEQTWADGVAGGTPLSAARLNHMEAGIEAANNAGFEKVEAASGTFDQSGTGANAGGYATGAGSTVNATGDGSFAAGYAAGGADITASSRASFAFGWATGTGSTIVASGEGGFAGGEASAGGDVTAVGDASVALGVAYGAAGSLYAGSHGSQAFGNANGGAIRAEGTGAFAQGRADIDGAITAQGNGSFASGLAAIGTIIASANGAFAQGQTFHADALISASGNGAHASGLADAANSQIYVSGNGAFAHGWAIDGFDVRATSNGAAAFGMTYGATVEATATNAFQFGPGTNNVANSLQVGAGGSGVHLHGGGAPGAPANGDMWVASGHVYVRTNGVTKNLDNI